VSTVKSEVQSKLSEEQKKTQEISSEQMSYQQQCEKLKEKLDKITLENTSTNQKFEKITKNLRTREAELQVSKNCFKQLKIFNDTKESKEKLAKLLDVIKIKSEFSSLEVERKELQSKLAEERESNKDMEDNLEKAKEEIFKALDLQKRAEADKLDALSKLSIRTEYFNEKQEELSKKLESECGLRQDVQGAADNVTGDEGIHGSY